MMGQSELWSLCALASISPENDKVKSCADSEQNGYEWEPEQGGDRRYRKKGWERGNPH